MEVDCVINAKSTTPIKNKLVIRTPPNTTLRSSQLPLFVQMSSQLPSFTEGSLVSSITHPITPILADDKEVTVSPISTALITKPEDNNKKEETRNAALLLTSMKMTMEGEKSGLILPDLKTDRSKSIRSSKRYFSQNMQKKRSNDYPRLPNIETSLNTKEVGNCTNGDLCSVISNTARQYEIETQQGEQSSMDNKVANFPVNFNNLSHSTLPRARTVSLDSHLKLIDPSVAINQSNNHLNFGQGRHPLTKPQLVNDPSITANFVSPPSSPLLRSVSDDCDLSMKTNSTTPGLLGKTISARRVDRRKRYLDSPEEQRHLNACDNQILGVLGQNFQLSKDKGATEVLNSCHNNNMKPITSTTTKKVILRKKFSWKNYPVLEAFLVANRAEYLRHSALNYTMQQKNYNNRLTERLLELASENAYIFDKEAFSFVTVRDRIRCYFKSYVQSRKKRGVIIGYAARKAGLMSEEEIEKSAGRKGKIIVPQFPKQRKE